MVSADGSTPVPATTKGEANMKTAHDGEWKRRKSLLAMKLERDTEAEKRSATLQQLALVWLTHDDIIHEIDIALDAGYFELFYGYGTKGAKALTGIRAKLKGILRA